MAVNAPISDARYGQETSQVELLAWFRLAGGRVGPLVIATVAGVRGVRATRAIAQDDELVHLPLHLAITPDIARRSTAGRLLAEGGQAPRDRAVVAAFLLETRRHGGYWAPYVNSLPREFPGHPLMFDDDALSKLDPVSMVGRSIRAYHRECESDHAKLCAVMPAEDAYSADEFRWGWCSVLSRAFQLTLEGRHTPALLPVVDLMNHAATPVTDGMTCADRYRVGANRPMAAGTEITCTYGQIGNQRLCPTYGFCLDDDRLDAAFIFPGSRGYFVGTRYASPQVRDLWSFLRAECLVRAGHAAPAQPPTAPVDARNEIACLILLKDACAAELPKLAAALAHYDGLRSAGDLSPGLHDVALACAGEWRVHAHYLELAGTALRYLQAPATRADSSATLDRLDGDYLLALQQMPQS